jgi:hypothetical protein
MTSPDSLANYYFDEDEADKVIGFFADALLTVQVNGVANLRFLIGK